MTRSRKDSRPGKLRVAVWVGLSDKKCLEKLRGLQECDMVEEGLLIRRHPVEGLESFTQICPPALLRFSAALSHLYALLITIPACMRFRPHVCVGISMMPHSLLAKLGQVASGARFVNWVIGTDLYLELRDTWWGRALRPLMRSAWATLCMGSQSKEELVSMGWQPDRVFVGRNAYDLSAYEDRSAEVTWDVIYTGRLDRGHKRLHLLLRAVAAARDRGHELDCAIVGKGPDRDRLERIRDDLGLNQRVQFLGYRSDIPELLNRSRILVMTSAWEGLPASIVEAFACGLPVVTSEAGDVRDIVDDGENGYIVTSDEPKDFAEAIIRTLTDSDLYARLSASAHETGEHLRREQREGVPAKRWSRALERAVTPAHKGE